MISPEILKNINTLSINQLAWLSGYCWAKTNHEEAGVVTNLPLDQANAQTVVAVSRQVLILSASQTGNAKRVADALHAQLSQNGIQANIQSIGDYKSKNLANEDIVLLVASTQGDGEYPEEAIAFAKFLFGKKAPDLSQVSYAVLALGDSSYPDFCQAGKNLDERLASLGATALLPRTDCDLDYQANAQIWQDTVQNIVQELSQTNTNPTINHVNDNQDGTALSNYHKDAPFAASLLSRQKITSRDAVKDTEHLEFDLSGSGISYQAGDALGVFVKNDPAFIQDFLQALSLTGHENIVLKNGEQYTLSDALSSHLELTQNSAPFIKSWAQLSQADALLQLVNDQQALQDYIAKTPLLAVVNQYPLAIAAQDWVDLLRPLTPRMYSIASSQDEVGEEVHITLGVVEYEHNQHQYTGVASGLLGQRLEEDETVAIFIEHNPRFRLPHNPETPIIMIGAGTGVAPFRAFMQQRENDAATGGNWLIFGNHKFTDDFLYQSEWQRWHKLGLLTQTSLAWSRQNPNEKVYVQHKIRDNAAAIWDWLQQGAHLYVCGDASNMAKSVEEALLAAIETHGKMSPEEADDYLTELREQQRYQRDVY